MPLPHGAMGWSVIVAFLCHTHSLFEISYGFLKLNAFINLHLLVSSADNVQTVWTQIRPDKMWGLIWIRTI